MRWIFIVACLLSLPTMAHAQCAGCGFGGGGGGGYSSMGYGGYGGGYSTPSYGYVSSGGGYGSAGGMAMSGGSAGGMSAGAVDVAYSRPVARYYAAPVVYTAPRYYTPSYVYRTGPTLGIYASW